jgi:hypothetical protein
MEERAIELLEKLADKLGVTIDQIWTILIYQAKIELGAEILVLIFLFGLFLFTGWFLIKFVIKKPCEKDSWDEPTDKELLIRIPIIVLFGVITLFFLLNFFSLIKLLPVLIFNPEYWALHQILKLM